MSEETRERVMLMLQNAEKEFGNVPLRCVMAPDVYRDIVAAERARLLYGKADRPEPPSPDGAHDFRDAPRLSPGHGVRRSRA